jgi:energy-coupling factor transport system permease protein
MTSLMPSATATGSWLGRRNPTVKLALVLAVSVVVMFVFDPRPVGVLYLLALLAVQCSTRMRPGTLAVAHLPFVGFALGVLLVNALSRPGEVLLEAGLLRVTAEGVAVGAALALRTMLVGVLSIGFIASTDPVALMTSLHQNARLSPRVTYAVLAGHRMLQEIPQEWETIRRAHAVRAPVREDGTLPRDVRSMGAAAFTLLVVSLRKGERMAQALESRGLGLSPRSTWKPVGVARADTVMIAVALLVVAAVCSASTLGADARI